MSKKYLLLIPLLIVPLLSSCKKDPGPTQLNISIAVQPVGGSALNSVSVIFSGMVTGTIRPVIVTVEWWWENGVHSDQELVLTTDYTFDTGVLVSKSSYCYAPSGYYLVNYYWAKITWNDDLGPHTLESNKAYFGD